MNSIPLTEKILIDAGGWQAMKHARALHESRRVTGASWAAPVLKGSVQDGGTEYRAGLKVSSPTNIENLCSCRASREWGTICAHSLAVGLTLLHVPEVVAAPVRQASASAPVPVPVPSVVTPFFPDKGEPVTLHIILAPNFDTGWQKDAVTLGAEVEHHGKRLLLSALNPRGVYRMPEADIRAVEALIAAGGDGRLPGFMSLTRGQLLPVLSALQSSPRVTLGRGAPVDVRALLAKISPALRESATAPAAMIPLGWPEFSLTVEGSLNFLTARLQAIYAQRVVTVGVTSAKDAFTYADPASGERRARNIPSEEDALKKLTGAGFTGPDSTGQYQLKGERLILRFFAAMLPALQESWTVSLGARFTNISGAIDRITPKLEMRGSGQDWFEVGVSLGTPGGESVSSAEIQRLLQMGQNHVRLQNGRVAVFDSGLLDELGDVLRDCDPRQQQPGVYRIDRMHAGYLSAVAPLELSGSAAWAGAERNLEVIEPVPLGALDATLRPYQKHGVYWLHFLAQNSFGGILADEMGLGKTLQALAFLELLKQRQPGAPALIICPASLVHNWEREAARWVPEMRVLAIQGSARERLFKKIAASDLVITSYPLLRRDIRRYTELDFGAVFLDEAQHIKNPETQNAQAAKALQARHRFVLTGTPMENSVRDLWSIMDFLMPGYLGRQDDFRERYELPIQQNDAAAKERLSKRLRPFMLRRRKAEVCDDLPEKIEQVAYCELTARQRAVYDELLKSAREQIEVATSADSAPKARMLMLTALLRLRQACCDLRLLQLSDTSAKDSSGKLDLLDELLQEAIDGGHRVLIFSQFVSMLTLLRERLDAAETAYCYLDGSTKNRPEVIDRFQNGTDVPVFLISLKAGGVGLNLTAADTVIHFDPWWNPAVEAQATDRTHRIGQRNVVTAYKLITRGTIEEKILTLQRAKRELIDATIESEEPLMTALTMREIEGLLR